MPRAAKTFETQNDLNRAIRALVKQDPRLARVVALTGMPTLRRRESGFAGLARIITGQQVSTVAATAIWGRVSQAFEPFSAEAIHRATPARLGKLGLSAAKTRALKSIAKEILDGSLDLGALATLDADAAHARLTALHGVGPWTADVYLLFCLGHRDAWPAADLAIQEGMRIGLELAARPTTKQATTLGDHWRPYRGAAAHLWWATVHASRARA
jgi:DNA-3-methyladenine glycosylase II